MLGSGEHGECSCGNELTMVTVQCIVCGQLICPCCVIKNEVSLCIFCANDQHCRLNVVEMEAMCKYESTVIRCDNPSEPGVVCGSRGCEENLKYCSDHMKKCLFCKSPICSSAPDHEAYCIQHKGKICDFCGDRITQKRKSVRMSQCVECDAYACKSCIRRIGSVFESRKKVPVDICRSHRIVCKNSGMGVKGCQDAFYRLEINKCDFPGCTSHACGCGIYEERREPFYVAYTVPRPDAERYTKPLPPTIPAKYACEEHIRICMHDETGKGPCLKTYAAHSSGLVKWRYSKHEHVCKGCFAVIRKNIECFLLVQNRLRWKLPKELFELILRIRVDPLDLGKPF